MTGTVQARVRVYNVGFGDSFLLDLPTVTGQNAKVLIDCGSLTFGDSGENTKSLVDRIIDDVTGPDGVPRIDVVVATHRHKDHISGFGRSEWSKVRVGEVWQPWTEDPDDTDARRLRQAQLELARVIVDSGQRLAAYSNVSAATVELVVAMGMNALSNAGAIETLRTGFAGSPTRRYLTRTKAPFSPEVLGGLHVHVLGPDRDVEVIRRMDPPSDQAYLALLPASEQAGAAVTYTDAPFGWLPRMGWEEYGRSGLAHDDPPRSVDHGGAKGQLRQLIGTDSLLSAAVLDSSLNNTSLMLCFEVGRQFLLFPGDAQWGAWDLAMGDSWSADLLARTTFYKIGHHGSHNATPRRFVESMMPKGCWSIASVAPYSRWTEIPKPDLLAALEKKSPERVFTTMTPPSSPPPEVLVQDGGKVLEFALDT